MLQGVKKEASSFTGVFGLDVIWSETEYLGKVRYIKMDMCPYVWLCRLELNPLKLACGKAYAGNNVTKEGIGAMYWINRFVVFHFNLKGHAC